MLNATKNMLKTLAPKADELGQKGFDKTLNRAATGYFDIQVNASKTELEIESIVVTTSLDAQSDEINSLLDSICATNNASVATVIQQSDKVLALQCFFNGFDGIMRQRLIPELRGMYGNVAKDAALKAIGADPVGLQKLQDYAITHKLSLAAPSKAALVTAKDSMQVELNKIQEAVDDGRDVLDELIENRETASKVKEKAEFTTQIATVRSELKVLKEQKKEVQARIAQTDTDINTKTKTKAESNAQAKEKKDQEKKAAEAGSSPASDPPPTPAPAPAGEHDQESADDLISKVAKATAPASPAPGNGSGMITLDHIKKNIASGVITNLKQVGDLRSKFPDEFPRPAHQEAVTYCETELGWNLSA